MNKYQDIEDVKAANEAAGGFYFSKNTMHFFKSRTTSRVHPQPDGGCLFVTSNVRSYDDEKRKYDIGRCSPEGVCKSLQAEGRFPSAAAAHRRAAELAKD